MKDKYTKTNWIDGCTKLDANKLNNIENGIENLFENSLSASEIYGRDGIKVDIIKDKDILIHLVDGYYMRADEVMNAIAQAQLTDADGNIIIDLSGKADRIHKHAIEDIEGLEEALSNAGGGSGNCSCDLSSILSRLSSLESRVAALEENTPVTPDVYAVTGTFSYPTKASASGGSLTSTNTLSVTKNGIAVSDVTITYSSNQSYATVDSTGKVTFTAHSGTSDRTATITATISCPGYTTTKKVTVTQEGTPIQYFTVTLNLTGTKATNTSTSVAKGSTYTNTISLKQDFENLNVVVTMGGNQVYSGSNGSISVSNVSGDIVITATATEIVDDSYKYINIGYTLLSKVDGVWVMPTINDFTSKVQALATTKKIEMSTITEKANCVMLVAPRGLELKSFYKHGSIEDAWYDSASGANVLTKIESVYQDKEVDFYYYKSPGNLLGDGTGYEVIFK